MGLCARLVPRIGPRQKLSQELVQELSQELLLRLELQRHPPIFNALTGLDGMLLADEILKVRNTVGVLIGGLLKELWKNPEIPANLDKHKDVDVAVLNSDFQLNQKFEGGIDWWLPKSGDLELRYPMWGMDDCLTINKRVDWFQNGNDIPLKFSINKAMNCAELDPGLYIPSAGFYARMRASEALTEVKSYTDCEHNPESIMLMRQKIKKSLTKFLPIEIQDLFRGQILDKKYAISTLGKHDKSLVVRDFEMPEEYRAIMRVREEYSDF